VSEDAAGGLARTLFLGSGKFALPVARALDRHPAARLLGVITAPPRDDPATEPPVAVWAHERGLPMLRPARLADPQTLDAIRRAQPELLVLADYGQIVPAELLDMPRFGALNLHPSVLPRHRGAAPIQAAILEGDTQSGVTIIQMDEGLDTGPIVAQHTVTLSGDESAPELEARLSAVAADLLTETLPSWLAGEITPEPQSADGATMTHALRREDGRLDPAHGVSYLYRQVRAYQPWPGTFLETNAGRVIVWDARPLGGGATRRSGTLLALPANRAALAASDGLLELIEVQPAGGRRMTGAELLRGRPALVGSLVTSPSAADEET
jgi:methionyl-tRNA formyltransferase